MNVIETSPPDTSGFTFARGLDTDGTFAGEFYGDLLRGMTHKLNNLLAVIQGFSSLIMMNDKIDGSLKENLDHMKEAAQNASGLSEQILSAGGCARITLQSLNLSEYLPMIDSNLRLPFVENEVPFEMNLAPGVPPVMADSGRLKEVVIELLKNAAEAAKGSGEATLDVFAPGTVDGGDSKCVDIFIKNTGSTIPEEKMADLFKPFNSTKDSVHYGIGLTTAAIVAAQMQIRLGIKSEPNAVTCWLQVPIAE